MINFEEFQFVTISFNQEHCIVEHLESIKYQVVNHGLNNINTFYLFDDYSTDDTVKIALEWLNYHPELFFHFEINVNPENYGIKRNYLRAINIIKSNNYSFLAADDLYFYNSIYDFVKYSHDKVLVFSPIISIFENEVHRDLNFLKLVFLNRYFKTTIKKRLLSNNIFSAPGSHLNFIVLSDLSYKSHLLSTKDGIYEDYPSWKYVYFVLNEHASFYNSELVIYRHKYNGFITHHFEKKNKIKSIFRFKSLIFNLINFFKLSRFFGIEFQKEIRISRFYDYLLSLGAKYK